MCFDESLVVMYMSYLYTPYFVIEQQDINFAEHILQFTEDQFLKTKNNTNSCIGLELFSDPSANLFRIHIHVRVCDMRSMLVVLLSLLRACWLKH